MSSCVTAPELSTIASQLADARSAMTRAQEQRAQDKQARRGPGRLWDRVVDFFRTTPPEANAEAAQATFQRIRLEAIHLSSNWVNETVSHRVAGDIITCARAAELETRLTQLRARETTALAWHSAARRAATALQEAARKASSASSTETLDLITSSKAISLMSSVDTSAARRALDEARAALASLRDALPKARSDLDLGDVDDSLDLAVDLVFDPGFDLFSMFNACALSDAARKSREAEAKLHPLMERLAQAVAGAIARVKAQQAQLTELHRPYREAAVAELPTDLRQLVA